MGCKERQRRPGRWPAGISWGLILSALLSAGFAGEPTDSQQSALLEQALAVVRDCMARAPAPWPAQWQSEYVDTIRAAVASCQDDAQYGARLQILREGFAPFWQGLKTGPDRSLFEVRRAQIRWYVEHLMATELSCEKEKQTLRGQYRDLTDHAARSLLAQFPFLDANMVEHAKADYLAECYRSIEAPLLPIFLNPFSEAQIEQIKQRWHDLRYARVDLWRQLDAAPPVNANPDYSLMQRSLAQLRPYIWAFVAPAPDYYRRAVDKEIDTVKRRFQARVEAGNEERRLGKAVLQTEYISFLLAALLETADSLHEEGRE
jgi:hypothetical protein